MHEVKENIPDEIKKEVAGPIEYKGHDVTANDSNCLQFALEDNKQSSGNGFISRKCFTFL